MKKIIGFVLLALTLQILLSDNFDIVSAAEESQCMSCYISPSGIDNYILSMKSMLSNLSSVKQEGNYDKKIMDTTYVTSKLIMAFPVEFFGQDIMRDFKIIFNRYPVVRDRKRVIQMDEYVSEIIGRSARNGSFDVVIPDNERNRYSSQLKSINIYTNVDIAKGTTYGELFGFLWKTHGLYKEMFMLMTNTNNKKVKDFSVYMDTNFKDYRGKFGGENELPSVNTSYIEDVQKQYECALKSSGGSKNGGCPDSIDKFVENIKKIMDVTGKISESIKKFKDSWGRLKEALKGFSGAGFSQQYKEREKKLYQIQFGGGPASDLLDYRKKGGMWGVGKMVDKANQMWDGVRTLANDADGYIRQVRQFESSGVKKESKPDASTMIQRDAREDLKNGILQTFNGVLSSANAIFNDIPLETPPDVLTSLPTLSKKVYTARQKAKDLQKELGEACENQCQNAGGKCYY